MSEFIHFIKSELNNLKEDNKFTTGEVRKLSAKFYKKLNNKSFDEKLDVCELLLKQRIWAMGIIAYDIAFRERENYTINTFDVFEKWLIMYVRDWYDCDDFCTHALGALLVKYNELYEKVYNWTKHKEFWVKRAAAVTFIYPLNHGFENTFNLFAISNALMNDSHYLVLKGYGWMLKVYGKYNPEELIKYLTINYHNMPRISFRYAIEKLDSETRKKLMKL